MPTTDGRILSSVAPPWPGAFSRRVLEDDDSWSWQRPHAEHSSNVAPEALRVSTRYQGDGSVVRALELAVMENGHSLESVELSAEPCKNDALVARAPDTKTLLVFGPTALSARERQNERLCSFGETRACEDGERVMFAFRFRNADDAERCFEILKPWLDTPSNFSKRDRQPSLPLVLGIPSHVQHVPTGASASEFDDAGEGGFVTTGRPTTAELMPTTEVVTMMEAVTTECVVSEAFKQKCAVAHGLAQTADIPAPAPETKQVVVDEEPKGEEFQRVPEEVREEWIVSMAMEASDTEGQEMSPTRIETAHKQNQTSPPESPSPQTWVWSAGLPPDVTDDTARAHVGEILRRCFGASPGPRIAASSAFANAPLGDSMPFSRYARLVGEALETMVNRGEISFQGECDDGDAQIAREDDEENEEYF